jgi:hypothetical protein
LTEEAVPWLAKTGNAINAVVHTKVHNTKVHNTEVHNTKVHNTKVHNTKVHNTEVQTAVGIIQRCAVEASRSLNYCS